MEGDPTVYYQDYCLWLLNYSFPYTWQTRIINILSSTLASWCCICVVAIGHKATVGWGRGVCTLSHGARKPTLVWVYKNDKRMIDIANLYTFGGPSLTAISRLLSSSEGEGAVVSPVDCIILWKNGKWIQLNSTDYARKLASESQTAT